MLDAIFLKLTPFHYTIGIVCIAIALFAGQLVRAINSPWIAMSVRRIQFSTSVLRLLSLMVLAATVFGTYLWNDKVDLLKEMLAKIPSVGFIFYVGWLLAALMAEISKLKYGRRRVSGDVIEYSDTYHSRAFSFGAAIIVMLLCLTASIQVLGWTSLFEAGGLIGFLGVLFVLTQGVWTPDVVSGLVLLNSEVLNEGDVITLDNQDELLFKVFRTRVFHTVLIDLVDNHRVMIRNSKLRDCTIHNLSKFGSGKGLRESLEFKIGYEISIERVRDLFKDAFEEMAEKYEGALAEDIPPETRAIECGDHAVTWAIRYYTKDVSMRLKTRQAFVATILERSKNEGISLATPLTMSIQQNVGDSPVK